MSDADAELISGELVERASRAVGPVDALRSAKALPAEAVRAVGELYETMIAKVLISPDVIGSRDELEERLDHLAGQTTVTNGALATGALAIVTRVGRRLPLKRLPSTVAITGSLAVGASVRAGVLELRAIASYLLHRADRAGVTIDTATLERLTLELYLAPTRRPAPASGRTPRFARLLWLWIRRAGVMPFIGHRRDEKRAARIAGAVDRFDLNEVVVNPR